VGFQPGIPTSKWPQIHALDCAATGISRILQYRMRKTFLRISNKPARISNKYVPSTVQEYYSYAWQLIKMYLYNVTL
jgi:hypothetical protein